MPTYAEIVDAAYKIGTLGAILVFVVLVQAVVIFVLLRMLQRTQKTQAEINSIMIENLVSLSNPRLGKGGTGEPKN